MGEQTKKEKPKIAKWIALGISLVLFVFLINPDWIFFLTEEQKDQMRTIGNLQFQWPASILKLVAIIAMVIILNVVIRLILTLIKPKTGKGKSLHSMLGSFTTWILAIVGVVLCLSASA